MLLAAMLGFQTSISYLQYGPLNSTEHNLAMYSN